MATVIFETYWWNNFGSNDPIFASALARVFFFISCSIVLHFIANANLVDLKIRTEGSRGVQKFTIESKKTDSFHKHEKLSDIVFTLHYIRASHMPVF